MQLLMDHMLLKLRPRSIIIVPLINQYLFRINEYEKMSFRIFLNEN